MALSRSTARMPPHNIKVKRVVKIRSLQPEDFPNWLPLWDGNNQGERDVAVTSETWSRLNDPASSVHGLCAVEGDIMKGLVHYILHPTTGAIANACYMQDVYVDPAYRGKGLAKKLVTAVAQRGKAEKWSRLYWIAEADNIAAQALYKNIGVKLDFTLHVMAL